MDLIRHQDTGANGLCIAATVCIVLGWIALLIGIIGMFARTDEVIFIVPLLAGAAGLGVMFLLACFLRGFASLVEAAQLYWNNNAPEVENEYE